MWTESESRLENFDRLSSLVRSQVRQSLANESSKSWLNLEQDLLEDEYRTIRDRQLELLEKEDGMLARPAIRELRDKLGRDAYDVISEQR
jgi:engulfment/cell motility protein 1